MMSRRREVKLSPSEFDKIIDCLDEILKVLEEAGTRSTDVYRGAPLSEEDLKFVESLGDR